ncbi:MAG: hypothetical protein ACRDRK_02835 [Pseudonocardia sp.]
MHVLAVDYLSQFREGSHVELLLGCEALEGGLFALSSSDVPMKIMVGSKPRL